MYNLFYLNLEITVMLVKLKFIYFVCTFKCYLFHKNNLTARSFPGTVSLSDKNVSCTGFTRP